MSKPDLHVKLAGGQQIVGGYSLRVYNAGAMGTGTFSFNPLNGNYQYATNTGAVAIQAPTVDCAMDILIENTGTAGAISFTGYTVGSLPGDPFTTTNGHKFILSIRRLQGTSTYLVKALQ